MSLMPSVDYESHVRRYSLILIGMLVLWLACELAAFLGIPHCLSPSLMLGQGAAAYNRLVWGVFFIYYVWSGQPLRAVLGTAAVGLALTLVFAVLLRPPLIMRKMTWETPVCLGFGLCGFVQLIVLSIRNTGAERSRYLTFLLPGCVLSIMIAYVVFFHFPLISWLPTTFDALLYAADDAFGFQPSFLMGQLFLAVPALAALANFFYAAIGYPPLMLIALQLRDTRPWKQDILHPMIVVSLLSVAMYCLFPAVGPVWVFPDKYPDHPPPADQVLAETLSIPKVPRNCMPSLHTTYVLLYWWQARSYRLWIRALTGAFLLFTVLNTLGEGLHYAVDLVVAFPFAMALQALCLPAPPPVRARKWLTVLGGALLTAGWMLVLRHGLELLMLSRILTWAAAFLTVSGSYLAERALYLHVRPFNGQGF